MAVPFFRADLNAATKASVNAVLDSGWFTTGKYCQSFENQMLARIAAGNGSIEGSAERHAVVVNSCTAGMHLALEGLGVQAGDEVIVPVLTFTATAEVVRYLGATPVFIDIDPLTLCIDVEQIEAKINDKTKAIMVVHFGGYGMDLDPVLAIAKKHDLKVVEDAAHALPSISSGAQSGKKFVGAHNTDATVYSFYANKTITTGEGGMAITRHVDVAERMRKMRLHGINRDAFDRFGTGFAKWQYDVIAPGFKYNMTDVAAAMGCGQLEQVDALHEKRQQVVKRYDEAFHDLPLVLPYRDEFGDHSWHLYVVQLDAKYAQKREEFLKHLIEHDIGFSIHYTPLHMLTYWRDLMGLTDDDFPAALSYFNRCATLPVFPSMRDDECDEVISVVRSFFG